MPEPASSMREGVSSDERRQQIISATQAVIVEKGFEGLRVRDVAERVGINHATLLYHFPTKSALIQGLLEHIVHNLDRFPPASEELSPRDLLQAHFAHILEQMNDAPEKFAVLNELFVRAGRDAEARRLLEKADADWLAFLGQLLRNGRAAGAFRRGLDPEATAMLVTSFFKGIGFQLAASPEQVRTATAQLEQLIVGASA
jgi:AcrR family transcriptional regulator